MLIIRKVFDIRRICTKVKKKHQRREKNHTRRKVFDEKNGYFIAEKKETKGT